MKPSRHSAATLLVLNGALLLIALLLSGRASAARAALTRELAAARSSAEDLARQRAANAHLRRSLPSPELLDQWRADRVAIEALRAELAALESNAQARLRAAEAAPAPGATRSERLTAKDWTNRGRTSPKDTLVTAVWAAIQGDVEVLAQSIQLTPEGRARAEAFLRAQPAVPGEARSPEHLVALLASAQMKAEAIEFLPPQGPDTRDETVVTTQVRLAMPGRQDRIGTFITVRQPGGWKLLVPDPIVEQYVGGVQPRS